MFKDESNEIIFLDMINILLVKSLVKIWHKLQRGPIKQDGGSTYKERSSPNYAYSTIKKASHNNGVQHNPPLK